MRHTATVGVVVTVDDRLKATLSGPIPLKATARYLPTVSSSFGRRRVGYRPAVECKIRSPGTAATGASSAKMEGTGTSATACNRPTPLRLIGRGEIPGPIARCPVVNRAFDGNSTRVLSCARFGRGQRSRWFAGLGRARVTQIVPSGRTSNESRNEKVSKLNARNNRLAASGSTSPFWSPAVANMEGRLTSAPSTCQQLAIDRGGDYERRASAVSYSQHAARSVARAPKRARCRKQGSPAKA